MELKRCSKCTLHLPLSSFYKGKTQVGGYRPACKDCDRKSVNKTARRKYENRYWAERKERRAEKAKQTRARHLESHNATLKAYRSTERFKQLHRKHSATRRAREAMAFVEHIDYREMYAESSKFCQYCGVPLEFDAVEFDHHIPIAKGGKHERSNIRISCMKCNRAKAAKLPWEVCHQVD